MVSFDELETLVQHLNSRMYEVGDGGIRLCPFGLYSDGNKRIINFMGGYALWDSDDEQCDSVKEVEAIIKRELTDIIGIMKQVNATALIRDLQPESPICDGRA